MQHLISVIVPVYNENPLYLKQAINSLYSQTLKDIEIIIVNDGSTNIDTLNFLQKLQQNDKLKIINQINGGLGNARNSGLKIANGKYIGFLDADDWVDDNFYKTLYDDIIKYSADISYGSLLVNIDQKYKLLFDIHNTFVTSNFLEKIKYVANGSVCSKLFKRDLFNDIKFVEHCHFEDNLALLQLLLKSNIVSFNDTVYYNYRYNNNSITHNNENIEQNIEDVCYILLKIKDIASTLDDVSKNIVIKTFLKIFNRTQVHCDNVQYKKFINKEFSKFITIETIETSEESKKILFNSLRKAYLKNNDIN